MTIALFGRRIPAAATYLAGLVTALFLVVLTVAAAFVQTQHQAVNNAAITHSLEVRSDFRNVLITLLNAETGQRGFLLTNDDSYFVSMASARDVVEGHLTALNRAAVTDVYLREDITNLADSARRKLDEMDETIALQRAGRSREALDLVRSDAGLRLMENIRALSVGMIAQEDARLNAALAESQSAASRLQFIILFAALLLVGIGALLFVAVRGAMREMRASRDEAFAARERVMQEMATREAAETKMLQMQKMEAIGQLTGGVAHDFNNMLAVITSALNLMQKRLERSDYDIGRFIDAAHDAARRAAVLTSRLLAFARRQPLAPTVIDVNRLVGGMSELLRRTLGENIGMETALAAGLWRTHADASQLENAIINICVNARDAMPESGKLTIETSNAFLDEVYAAKNTDVKPGQYVLVAITDTGSGMTSDVLAKVFEPFFTTKEVGKGTGLGLSHVHGFLKQSGGHIAIYSELGHGTTIKLYLPRTQDAETPERIMPDRGAAPQGEPGTWILVVEDEERVRVLSVAALRELGYSVLHASTGTEALAVLGANQQIALLFTDIVMPDMSGRKLADEALRRRPELKVLYTTGYTQNAIVHNGVLDADARLLLKPYSLDDLAHKVRSVLDEK